MTARHILTPGERGEWEIEVKEGESIIATAKSEVFDPAIEIVDANEVKLVENDDVAPGVQRAQVLYRFPAPGKYKVLVKGFQAKAGGPYDISLRRFTSVALRTGGDPVVREGDSRQTWVRYDGKKGVPMVVTLYGVIGGLQVHFAPTGEVFEPAELFHPGGEQYVIVPELDGEYYIHAATRGTLAGPMHGMVSPARESATTIGLTTPKRTLNAGELDIWSFEAEEGQLLDIRLLAPNRDAWFFVYEIGESLQDFAERNASAWESLRRIGIEEKNRANMTVLATKKGRYQIAVIPRTAAGLEYEISLSDSTTLVPLNGVAQGSLAIGSYQVWGFQGEPGQVVRLHASAQAFDSSLTVYTPSGRRIALGDDSDGSINAEVEAVLAESGRYFVVVSAYGGGGSGAYTFTKTTIEPTRAKIGTASQGKIVNSGGEVWVVDGKAGQSLIVSVRADMFDALVVVYGPSGEVVAEEDYGDGDNPLLVVRFEKPGRYTIRVSSQFGTGKYSLWLFDVGT
ncbi:MAG: PPC domain-containing protein [Fimbriimonadaceae bacterium]